MKTLLYFAILITTESTFSGCSRYQYASLQSDLPKAMGNAILENDTARVTYTFKGKNCPVQIQVANKGNKPLYIDWKKSALIIADQRISYWEDKTILNTTTRGYEVELTKTVSSSSATTKGELIKNEQVSFIPPKSFVSVVPLTAKSSFFKLAKPEQRIAVTNGDPPLMGIRHSFGPENSPMKFRSYLTLSFDQNFDHSFSYDNQFWVSEIIETGMSAPGLNFPITNDQFTIEKTTGFGTFMGGLAAVAVLVGLVALKR